MYQLQVTVKKVMGTCTADPPMKPGDSFTVSDGDLQIPEGGYICLWALQSLLPLLPAKERELAENPDDDWMWRVKHAQCPDPNGRVIFKIERTGKVQRDAEPQRAEQASPAMRTAELLSLRPESRNEAAGTGGVDFVFVGKLVPHEPFFGRNIPMPKWMQEYCPRHIDPVVEQDRESKVEERQECRIKRVAEETKGTRSTEPFSPG